eukprot:GHVN01014302.1.p1 GENE.GHVN01014302.1~~GHVN01014302.1.p1  ORF type:complete len:287 (+),score=21.48 GHVN01014302.1:345-1205(+)
MFDDLYKRHATPAIAKFFGGSVLYDEPYDSDLGVAISSSAGDYIDASTWISAKKYDGDFSITWIIDSVSAGGVIGLTSDTVPTETLNFNSHAYNTQLNPISLITRTGSTVDIVNCDLEDGDEITFQRSGTDVWILQNGDIRKTWTDDLGDTLYPVTSLAESNQLLTTLTKHTVAAIYTGANIELEVVPTEPFTLTNVILGDIRIASRAGEHMSNIVHERTIQMVTDSDVENYCGIETPMIGGQIIINGEEWIIEEKPAADSDGFTKCELIQHQRHEIGNKKARGNR